MYSFDKNGEINGGDMLVKAMINEGVEYVFGIIGGQLLPMVDAIHRWGEKENIHTIGVRNEQGAGFMADACTRVSGKISACFGTVGPGLTNLLGGVDAAWGDNIPILAITPQLGPKFDDHNPLQGGVDQIALMKPITKYHKTISDPNRVVWGAQKAFRELRSGRPAPVLLEITEDAFYGKVTFGNEAPQPERYRCVEPPMGAQSLIEKACQLLATAARPLIVSGGGVTQSSAWSQLQKLSSKYRIPVVTSFMGIGTMSTHHETYVGATLGQGAVMKGANEADVVLALGTKFSYVMGFGKAPVWNNKLKLIQVDIDPQMIGKNRLVDVGIIGDCGKVIEQITAELDKKAMTAAIESDRNNWIKALQTAREQGIQMERAKMNSDKTPMTPHRVIKELTEFMNPEDPLTIDGGDIAVFATNLIDYVKPRDPRTALMSIGMGHLGTCIPYAIGAKLGKPKARSFAITGDGSFLFNVQELDTAVRYKIPFVCVIANNNCWGMIKNVQKRAFEKRFSDCDLPETDYVGISKGFGCYAERVEKPGDIKAALQRAVDSQKPAVLDIPIEFVSPPGTQIIKSLKALDF